MSGSCKDGVSSPGFREFWDAYGLKRDRVGAEAVWRRMSKRDRRAAVAGIAAYRDGCRRSGVAMAHASRYLSHRRWEDEYDAAEDAAPRQGAMEEW